MRVPSAVLFFGQLTGGITGTVKFDSSSMDSGAGVTWTAGRLSLLSVLSLLSLL